MVRDGSGVRFPGKLVVGNAVRPAQCGLQHMNVCVSRNGKGLANYFADPAFRALLRRPPQEDPQAAVQTFLSVYVNPLASRGRTSRSVANSGEDRSG